MTNRLDFLAGYLSVIKMLLVEVQLSSVCLLQKVYAAQQRCFAAAARAEDSHYIALINLYIYTLEHLIILEGFADICYLEHCAPSNQLLLSNSSSKFGNKKTGPMARRKSA